MNLEERIERAEQDLRAAQRELSKAKKLVKERGVVSIGSRVKLRVAGMGEGTKAFIVASGSGDPDYIRRRRIILWQGSPWSTTIVPYADCETADGVTITGVKHRYTEDLG